MNPTATSSHSGELKSTNYSLSVDVQSLVPTTTSASEPMPMGQLKPSSYVSSSGGSRYQDTTISSFTPLVTVDTSGTTDFPDYFSPSVASPFNAPSGFSSHHTVQPTYASMMTETDLYGGRQPPQQHLPYANSGTAPSLQRFIGGLTSKLPDLQCAGGSCTSMDVTYSAPHMVGLASSPHTSLISPAYSPSSVTTQGSGSAGKRTALETENKPGAFKSRSKKESHNRIERRRRDYINSQITRLSGLLPVDMYRDVDGRRNKGTVLRLSVNYILELRQAVAHTASLRQETAIARQLIPLLLSHIQTLESIIKEVQMLPGKRLGNDACGSTTMLDETPRAPETAYEGVLEAWRTAMTTNLARAAAMAAMVNNGADASRENKVEAKDLPLMDNVQAAFVGRPSTTVGAAGSPYLPNAIFMGGGVCKLEEGEGGCYEGDLAGEHITGSTTTDTSCGPHPPPPSAERTTDGFFDSNNAPKFDITIMQLAAGGGSNDCGDPMQVECQNR